MTYRLVETSNGLGIYREGVGGFIVDPNDTMLFDFEIRAIFRRLNKCT
jgi:hypothetical protein